MFKETFKGYCMAKDGSYGDPVIIEKSEDFSKFIMENVTKYYELRITDDGDLMCFHVVDQVLVHPIPLHGKTNNKWNDTTKRFETVL
jgi:hypothetical protein